MILAMALGNESGVGRHDKLSRLDMYLTKQETL